MYDWNDDNERYGAAYYIFKMFADCFEPFMDQASSDDEEWYEWKKNQTRARIIKEAFGKYKLEVFSNDVLVFEFCSSPQMIGNLASGIKF